MAATIAPVARGQERQFQIDVAAQPLGQALIAFAVQTNISISTQMSGLAAITSRPLRGRMSTEAGLRRLVEGTGFVVHKIDAVTYVIARDKGQPQLRQALDAEGSDVVVVTGAALPSTLDRFAASADVLDNDALQRAAPRSTNDLAESIAGLSFTNLGPGRDKIILRGLSDGAFTGRTESTIGIYVGDSRISYGAPDPDLKLVDIEQVEVLRGPQGVLYGSGSVGGIYRINPMAPDLERSSGIAQASAEITEGGGSGWDGEGVLNVPIVKDRLGLRVAGWRETTGGWLDNNELGLRNTNSTLREGYRATALAQFGDSWSVTLSTLQQTIDSRDSQYIGAQLGERERQAQILEPHDNDFGLIGITVRGATPIGEFTSTTSFLRHEYDSRFDATGAFVDFGIDPKRTAAFDDRNQLDFVTEEARLTGLAARFPWVVGVSASIGKVASESRLSLDPGGTAPAIPYDGDRLDHIHQYALYGDVSAPLTRTISLSVGIRGFLNQLSVRAAAASALPGLQDNFSDSRQDTGIAPQIRLAYEPPSGGLYYIQASNGYRSGGFNAGAGDLLTSNSQAGTPQPFRTYGSDNLWSFETGIKRSLFADRLKVRAAAFLQSWQNIQTDQLTASHLPFTGNLGNGQIGGLELETAYRWSDSLRITSHLTYANVTISDTSTSFPVGSDAGLPGTPALTGGGAIDYQKPLGDLGLLQVHLGGVYVGRSRAVFADQSGSSTGGYVDVNLRVGVERESWTATLYIDNLTSAEGATFSFGNTFRFGADDLVTPLRPRTFGVEFARRF